MQLYKYVEPIFPAKNRERLDINIRYQILTILTTEFSRLRNCQRF